jgi:hypothetical protein
VQFVAPLRQAVSRERASLEDIMAVAVEQLSPLVRAGFLGDLTFRFRKTENGTVTIERVEVKLIV